MRIIILCLSLISIIACNNKTNSSISPKTPAAINALTDSLNNKKADFKNVNKRLITMLYEYAVKYPQDTLSDDYLFTAGYYERNLYHFQRAMEIWDKLVKDYPNYARLVDVMFYQGYMAENEMKDLTKARAIYEDFIRRWPNHTYTPTVRAALDHLGKTPEQVYDEIKKKEADSTKGK